MFHVVGIILILLPKCLNALSRNGYVLHIVFMLNFSEQVLVINPLTPAGQMIIVKILSGKVFGKNQLVDLILLVYSNEKPAAEMLKNELFGCGYRCYNYIIVSSDLPSISDADVFCFMSNFADPNKFNFDKLDSDEQFDSLYLMIKLANTLCGPLPKEKTDDEEISFKKRQMKPESKPRKPIIMADGLAAIDILMSLSKDLPPDIFFCPTATPDVAKAVLADHLKVECNVINDTFVWAANDHVVHVEVEKPLVIHDQVNVESECDWNMVSNDLLRSIDYDHTQFSPFWMKKEFIDKVTAHTTKNPYGCIFRASVFCNALKCIWQSRRDETEKKFYCNIGVVSDGSLGTTKGYPYILPVVFSGDSWSVNKRFEEDVHVKQEIKRIKKAVKEHHQLLIPYCKKFLRENVINQEFMPESERSSEYSINNSSKSSSNY